ncbi:TPA: hypothetical protein O0K08_002925, partial [Staphylococcus aureus]|nr:hypothetical protein [Staphylococcus aureus]HCX7942521.1 hypothetical protein [Staphylococcus aureus]HCX8402122.1 hypothetical protein [Staphylococcus aureus]HCX8695012.1 hypothetical protein [Staphylococcus aureus]HCX8787673.1 hypothetical protein [Staphylococcus aureus]
KKEAQAETDKSAAVSNEEPKAVALKAQQAAIKEEASANNLSDTSQEAQEIQEAKREAQAEADKSVAVSNEESKASALKVQQAAIKEEASANNLSDTSQEAQEIQEA